MSRRMIWAAVTALALIGWTHTSQAVELTSAVDTLTSVGEPLSFDFNSDPDLASVSITDSLVGIRIDWELIPGGSNYSNFKLRANLFLADVDSGVVLDSLLNGSPASANASSENMATTLTVSDEVISALLGGNYGLIDGAMSVLATNIPNLIQFFDEGGTMNARLTLITDSNPGGGGDPVPEPAALWIWGIVAAAGLGYRRYAKRTA